MGNNHEWLALEKLSQLSSPCKLLSLRCLSLSTNQFFSLYKLPLPLPLSLSLQMRFPFRPNSSLSLSLEHSVSLSGKKNQDSLTGKRCHTYLCYIKTENYFCKYPLRNGKFYHVDVGYLNPLDFSPRNAKLITILSNFCPGWIKAPKLQGAFQQEVPKVS
ncbi:hypothetical protein AMTRI_Chr11g155220 [Amborella trichopoda]